MKKRKSSCRGQRGYANDKKPGHEEKESKETNEKRVAAQIPRIAPWVAQGFVG